MNRIDLAQLTASVLVNRNSDGEILMRRIVGFALLIVLAAVTAQEVSAQSAGKIIDRYKKAVGGGATKRIKNTLMTGSVKTQEGTAGSFSYRAAAPDRLRVDTEAGGVKVSQCYNGKSAWRQDSRGLRTLLGPEAKQLRLEALLANGYFRDLSRNKVISERPVKSTVEGRDTYTIEFSKDNAVSKLFFDAGTGLIIKQERQGVTGPEEIFYGDHRAIDGVREPFSIRIKSAAGELVISIDRVEHNRAQDDVAFRYPRVEGDRPLPDLESVLKSLIANQEKVEEMRERYSCKMIEVERKLDGKGRVKETETKVYEVTPVGNRPVRRLMSVNGKELSAAEREKEDRRVQKEVEEIIKRREREQQKRERALARGEQEEKDEDRVTILDFLRISEITSVRRETFRGHEVIAFDFEPRKGFKPQNRTETIVSKLAGTIWVDENARQVARLEARLIDSFKLGGGLLASILPSTAFVFEQDKIGDEVWLPSYGESNISARVMLFAKFNRSTERRYSDYKKYQIDSQYELRKPDEVKKPEE
jgi:hypothetical protein